LFVPVNIPGQTKRLCPEDFCMLNIVKRMVLVISDVKNCVQEESCFVDLI
jgi:hypothetical protein